MSSDDQAPITQTLGTDFPYAALAQPAQIGPYHILSTLGEGGMGVVYKAEQRSPVKRVVALKLIKIGMDTREVIARFESERQALAMMNHPNVAKVLDAGTTETGRPYFVMEYVAGIPITTYCDQHNFSIRQRLELFIQACEAIEHAHQKALVHRDLKPSNILVTEAGEKPLLKVIDFGVAKATNQRLTERTLFTQHGQLVGTPEYMSPEQAEMSGLDVDTRSDIYSLGVVLYELLTGTLPFESKTLRSAAYNEIQRIIRELDPPRPSSRLSSLGPRAAEDVARRRQTQVPALCRQLKNELEWVPLKAMRNDRAQRYRTASEFAGDIRNYLQQRPLSAGPESGTYRLRKFVRRNSGAVAAAVAVLVTLTAGIIATSIALVGQSRARAEAEAANRSAQAVNDFLTKDVIGAADPAVHRGRELSVREALDNAARSIEKKFTNRPLVEATVRSSLASAYVAVGQADLALPHAQWALETRRRLLGDDHIETLMAMNIMGELLLKLGRMQESEALWREALERARRVLGREHALTLGLITGVGGILQEQGRLAEAEPLQREAVAGNRRVLGNDNIDTLTSINNLGNVLHRQGKLTEAEPLYREALQGRRRVLGDDHPHTLYSIANLGVLLAAQGKLAEAEPLYVEALEVRRRVLGDDHPDTLMALSNMGYLLMERGKMTESESAFREAVDRLRRVLGDDHPQTLVALNNLAGVKRSQGKLSEAEPLFREALERRRRVLGDDHGDTLASLYTLSGLLGAQRRQEQAEPLLAELYRRASQAQISPQRAAMFMASYGPCLIQLNRTVEAEAPLREAYRRLIETDQRNTPPMRNVVRALAELCQRTGREEEAAEWRAELGLLAAQTAPATTPAQSPGRR